VPNFDARWHRPETLQAIFDQISDGIFFYDKNLRLVRVNKGGEKLFRLSAEAMIGKSGWELFGRAASESSQNIPPGISQSRRLPTGTVWLHMDNGRDRRVIIQTIELLDESGALEGVVATVTDITAGENEAIAEFMRESPPLGETVNSGPERRAQDKYVGLVLRNRRAASVVGALFLILFVVFVVSYLGPGMGKQLTPEEKQRATAEQGKREAAARFNAMTPAQHIEQAKKALRPGATSHAIAEGLWHLKAIPLSAPEASRANALQQDLTRAGNLASAQSLIDASSNADVRDGMDKLQRAMVIIEGAKQQYPDNKDADQVSRAAQTAAEQLAMRFPREFASAETKLVDFTWEKGGFGTVMMANFTVRNDSPVDVADLKIHCDHYAANGVVLDQNAGTAYAIVKARSTTRIPNVNMGFLNPQSGNSRTTKTNCEILSVKLASESQASTTTR
jgi:PAS domain S-box-containing protein